MSIKEMVKNKVVRFLYFRENNLYYTTECGFEFPVPIDDVGTAAMNAEDKAILFMRWIRKEMDNQEIIKQAQIDHILKMEEEGKTKEWGDY